MLLKTLFLAKPFNRGMGSIPTIKQVTKQPTKSSFKLSSNDQFTYKSIPTLNTLYIISTRNNTRATFIDSSGKTICDCTAGKLGFRKAARGTQDVGHQVAVRMSEMAVSKGYKLPQVKCIAKVKGFGPGREQGLRGLISAGWGIVSIIDDTPFNLGNARPKKRRRI